MLHRLLKILSMTAVAALVAGCTGDDVENPEGLALAAALESGSAVVSMEDGTVYEFELTRCETSNNAEIFELSPGFAVEGLSEAGHDLIMDRGLSDPAFSIGSVVGPRGVASGEQVAYGFNESDSAIELQGDAIFGELVMVTLGGDPIHGEETSATLMVRC